MNARIREGDYDARIQVVSNDEIGVLGDSGNAMIHGLAERKTLRTAFGRYVTPEIRDEILSGRIPLEGERREGTVMFADLENFTPFVENNPPEEVMRSMRTYFTRMQQAIRSQRGLVIQFAGDEIEAVFGVPVYFETHGDAAVRAALEMRAALEILNRERTAQGKTVFAHGIGIHSGSVLAGNSGSEEQSAYSLIGNTVNVAARIEGLTREVGCDILVSEETVKQPERSASHGTTAALPGEGVQQTHYRLSSPLDFKPSKINRSSTIYKMESLHGDAFPPICRTRRSLRKFFYQFVETGVNRLRKC